MAEKYINSNEHDISYYEKKFNDMVIRSDIKNIESMKSQILIILNNKNILDRCKFENLLNCINLYIDSIDIKEFDDIVPDNKYNNDINSNNSFLLKIYNTTLSIFFN